MRGQESGDRRAGDGSRESEVRGQGSGDRGEFREENGGIGDAGTNDIRRRAQGMKGVRSEGFSELTKGIAYFPPALLFMSGITAQDTHSVPS